MKKFLIILLLVGCAHAPTYHAPTDLSARMYDIGAEVRHCITPSQHLSHYIDNSQDPGAYIIENKIVFTEGLFQFDDDTLRFVMAHEISHDVLGHIKKSTILNNITIGIALIANAIIPGIGVLNLLVNPTVMSAFSREKELEADKLASETCLCLGMSIPQQVVVLRNLQAHTPPEGGLWAKHPSWDDRIKNIKEP